MDLTSNVVQVVFALVATLAIVWGCAMVARRMMNGAEKVSGAIHVIGLKSLSARERLLLVQVEDKRFLLGVTQQSINALATFDNCELPQSPPGPDFSGMLNNIMQRK